MLQPPHALGAGHATGHWCVFASQLPPVHGPQLTEPPQPSDPPPHAQPSEVQVLGVHPHALAFPPPPHVAGGVQAGQSTVPPHPSEMLPHTPAGHVFGTHTPAPHLWSPPPPHVSGAVHVPHESAAPQPSLAVPHAKPRSAHVMGWQMHTCPSLQRKPAV
jgi:hypothetical protein